MSMKLPLNKIRPNVVALRPAQTTEDDYKALKANIMTLGEILQPVRVRKKTDAATNEEYWELIDGLQRFSIATELGWTEIPAVEASPDDMRVLVEQIALNASRVTTKHAAYGQQLARVMEKDPSLTLAGMAELTGMSESWVGQHTSLGKLLSQLRDVVDSGAITLTNGYQLSRLPQEEQIAHAEMAQSQEAPAFAAVVSARLKEIRRARSLGRQPGETEFKPVPLLRKSAEVRDADPKSIVQEAGAQTAEEGAAAAIKWCLRLNPVAANEQVERHKVATEKQKADKLAAQAERAAASVEKAQQRAAELRAQLGLPPETVAPATATTPA